MDQSGALNNIQSFIDEQIKKWPEVFLVNITVGASNKVTVLLDADNGMNIARCAEVNRSLYKYIESESLFGSNNFSIEVSSPGIDRPLSSQRQYQKNIGRNVEVQKNDESLAEGKLIAADDIGIVIEEASVSKKKNLETNKIEIPFSEIRQVKVLVTF